MSPGLGTIKWIELTMPNAEEVRDFYREVTGWEPTEVSMGDYSDFCMTPPGGAEPIAGVCHARGLNAALPPVWLMYILVDNLESQLDICKARGGKIIRGPRKSSEYGTYAVIQDPAGAVATLFEAATPAKV